jgi:hypothetical protein
VSCRRHLAACRLALAGKGLARALMDFAASPNGTAVILPVPLPGAVTNALVRRAWQLHAGAVDVPQRLLLPDRRGDMKEDRQQAVVDALEQVSLQHLALRTRAVEDERDDGLRYKAIKHYVRVAAVGVATICDTGQRTTVQMQRRNESFSRASRAADWSVLAVEACLAGKDDVAELYERAAQLAVTVETNINGLRRKMGPDDEAQQLGDAAGMRFAEAARALAAGKLPLYQRWLSAAEATAKLVTVITPKVKGAEPKLNFSATYSGAAVKAADELQAEAVALQAELTDQGPDAGDLPSEPLSAVGCGKRRSEGGAGEPAESSAKRRTRN